ncbi:hypothetical protein FNV43_RR19405 [Rhamnella rubrinervis]|uniref:Uncharacterized protein n=1 Tax=Rhamnella rubrinervis TaxID=2594499 RepID=A0A8K0DWR1_9ROSA|nr:hypothetical protein FNV43_RR19405 [Rhamnella rubrinervis]
MSSYLLLKSYKKALEAQRNILEAYWNALDAPVYYWKAIESFVDCRNALEAHRNVLEADRKALEGLLPELKNLVEDSMKQGRFDIEFDLKKGSRRHICGH